MPITLEKTLAASPRTERGQPTHLSTDAKGELLGYASGKSIFLRSIDDPSTSKQYIGHTAQTTVVRFPPATADFKRIASGDETGYVRIWEDLPHSSSLDDNSWGKQGDYAIFSGKIKDLAFTLDAKNVMGVGDGRQAFGRCIMADSGNTVGEVSGHVKVINAVAMSPVRPMWAATVSDDMSVAFLKGTPFKFHSKYNDVHKNFVLGTAFSPDGNKLVTVSSDRSIQLFEMDTTQDPKVMKYTREIGKGQHEGSIFCASWSKDSKRFVTASADRTVKMWDVETDKVLYTWRFGEDGDKLSWLDHQVGLVWPQGRSDDLIISLSLRGDLNYLKEGSEKPVKVIQGHNKNIQALGSSSDGKTLWTASFDGKICSWDVASGTSTALDGQGHNTQITGITSLGGRAYSVGWDDTLRILDGATHTYLGTSSKLSAQPKGIASADGRVYVATLAGVETYVDDKLAGKLDFSGPTPTAIAAHGSLVAVGTISGVVKLFRVDSGNKLTETAQATAAGAKEITAVAFARDGSKVAVGNAEGKIRAYKTAQEKLELATDRWSAHRSRVTSIAWNEAGTHAVSGSLDTDIYVWSLEKPGERDLWVHKAHKDGVTGVCWVEGGKVASTGGDSTIKIWKVDY